MMKSYTKYINLALLLFLPLTHYSQVQTGINTKYPRQLFHVDGKNDNPSQGVISEQQELNDVVITANGDLGIGVVEPNSALHVNGSYSGKLVMMNANETIDANAQYVIVSGTATTIKLPDASTIEGGRVYTLRNNLTQNLTISAFVSNQTINVDSQTNPSVSVTLKKGESLKIVRSLTGASLGNAWYALYSNTKIVDASIPTYYLGGTVYVKYNQISGGGLSNTRLIGGAPNVSYSIGGVNASSKVGGIDILKGRGYTISNPSAGIFDIQFDKAFVEIYGMSVNIVDAYGYIERSLLVTGLAPKPDEVGKPLNTKDNTQISFISNTKIRIKTGNEDGLLSNRSFTFLVVGK